MTIPIDSISSAIVRIRQYLVDERPLNLNEMESLLNVLLSVKRAGEQISANTPVSTKSGPMCFVWREFTQKMGISR